MSGLGTSAAYSGKFQRSKIRKKIPTVFSDLDINDGPFTPTEYSRVKGTLKRRKMFGPDELPPEVLIECDIDDIVLKICNHALMSGDKPGQWSYSNIISIPKSGNLSNPNNHRGIVSVSLVFLRKYTIGSY